MATPTYTVRSTQTAVKRLKTIPDRRIQRAIHTRAGQPDHDPEQQGIALLGEFMGFRRVEAVGTVDAPITRASPSNNDRIGSYLSRRSSLIGIFDVKGERAGR